MACAVGRPSWRELEALREQAHQDLAQIMPVAEGGAYVGEPLPHRRLDLLDQRGELARRPAGGPDLSLEMPGAREPLLQLGDQLGDVVGQGHGFREPLLLGGDGLQLGLQHRDVGLVLWDLRAISVRT